MDVEFWSPTGQEWEGLIVRRTFLRAEASEPAAGTAGSNCFGPSVSEGNIQGALDLTARC